MYRKDSVRWIKHVDFIILDLICLQVAFVLAYALSGYGANPYQLILYRNMAIFMEVADLVAQNGAPTTDVKGVKISVPALTSGMSDVAVVHYSTARSTWEVITPDSVDLENKEVTASFKDLSPVAVIAKVDASKAADNATGTAPKTGVEANNSWMAWGCAAVVLMAAAVLTFKKKRV